MHEGSEPDSLLVAIALVLPREAFNFRAVVGKLERSLHQPAHVHLFADHLPGGGGLPCAEEIAAAKLLRAQAHRARHLVQVALERKGALGRAEAAKSAVRRRIGGDGVAADANVRANVRPGGVNGAAREHHRRQSSVGAPVNHEINFHPQ